MPNTNRSIHQIHNTQQASGMTIRLPLAALVVLFISAYASGQPTTKPTAPEKMATPSSDSEVSGKTGGNSITINDAYQHFAYALVSLKDGSNIMLGTGSDVREIESRRAALASDFLWARRDKQRYLVTAPAILTQAQALWSPVRETDAQIDRLTKQMDIEAKVVQQAGEQKAAKSALDKLELQMHTQEQKRDAAAKAAERELRLFILDIIKHGTGVQLGDQEARPTLR